MQKIEVILTQRRGNEQEKIPVTSPGLEEGANPLDGCSSPGAPAQQENEPQAGFELALEDVLTHLC